MSIADHLIAPHETADASDRRPLGIVDLDAWPENISIGSWPVPLIGIGDPAHPAARQLDAIVEPPVSEDTLIRGILAAPLAAATIARLLRATEGLAIEPAIAIESMAYAMLQGSAEHAAWLARRAKPDPRPAGSVAVERQGDRLAVTLDRSAARNAIDRTMRDGLHEAFALAALDRDIATIRLDARGPAFSVGADLAEFGTTRDPATAHAIRMRTLPAVALARSGARFEAHVQGACVGAGLELAAFAERITASANAWFQLPELAMGILPGAGGTVSVPRRIGRQRAVLMMLSGRRIDAATALGWGLIDAIVDAPPGDEGGAHPIGG